jgi:DNA-damage-inducible protein D
MTLLQVFLTENKYSGVFNDQVHMKIFPTEFDGQTIRRVYDEANDIWWFSVIDVVQALTDSENARDYWFKMKIRVKSEDGAELSTFCRQLKLPAADGKQRLGDVANTKSLLLIIQSIPSPKAEPIKLWLAKVGYERLQEMADPALSLNRARQTWQQHGRSEKWIVQRMTGQETRNKRKVKPENPWCRARASCRTLRKRSLVAQARS